LLSDFRKKLVQIQIIDIWGNAVWRQLNDVASQTVQLAWRESADPTHKPHSYFRSYGHRASTFASYNPGKDLDYCLRRSSTLFQSSRLTGRTVGYKDARTDDELRQINATESLWGQYSKQQVRECVCIACARQQTTGVSDCSWWRQKNVSWLGPAVNVTLGHLAADVMLAPWCDASPVYRIPTAASAATVELYWF